MASRALAIPPGARPAYFPLTARRHGEEEDADDDARQRHEHDVLGGGEIDGEAPEMDGLPMRELPGPATATRWLWASTR